MSHLSNRFRARGLTAMRKSCDVSPGTDPMNSARRCTPRLSDFIGSYAKSEFKTRFAGSYHSAAAVVDEAVAKDLLGASPAALRAFWKKE
jgi:hypothetical protein